MTTMFRIVLAVAVATASVAVIHARAPLACTPAASSQWSSGWCDFPTAINIHKGERLRLMVGGTATRVLVRFLRKGDDPNAPGGIVTRPLTVPSNRLLEVEAPYDMVAITQVSIHGGKNPWNQVFLGADNGPATVLGVERLP